MQPSDEMIERIARSICHSDHPCWSIVAEIMCQPSYQPGFEGDAGSITQAGRYRQHAEAAHHALTASLPPEGDDAELVERLRGDGLDAARRLIAESFRRDNEYLDSKHRPRFSIPCRPNQDDDCVVIDALKSAADSLTAQAAEIARLKQERDAVQAGDYRAHGGEWTWREMRDASIARATAAEAKAEELTKENERLREAAMDIAPYLRWTISNESPGYHPTMPSAVGAFHHSFGIETAEKRLEFTRSRHPVSGAANDRR